MRLRREGDDERSLGQSTGPQQAISAPRHRVIFGPAMQIPPHIEVSDLAQSHLKDLAKWVENSGAPIMDAAKAAEIAKKIAAL